MGFRNDCAHRVFLIGDPKGMLSTNLDPNLMKNRSTPTEYVRHGVFGLHASAIRSMLRLERKKHLCEDGSKVHPFGGYLSN